MKLSIVTSLYNSELFIEKFYHLISKYAKTLTEDYEIIVVNDGSPDSSLELIKPYTESDTKLKIIDLSKNFGHHKALFTGLEHAKGEKIFLIDCDLEEDPKLLLDFYSKMEEEKDVDVVYGQQEKRNGHLVNKFLGYIYYKFVNKLTNNSLPKDLMTVRIMTKRYIRSLLLHQEKQFNIAGLWNIVGFTQIPLLVKKSVKAVSSNYDLRKKIDVLVNSITSFSSKPLEYIFYMGSISLIFCFLYVLYVATLKLVYKTPVSGWASVIISVWLFGALIIFSMGILGIYLSKVYAEVKSRPRTVIKEIYQNKSNEKDAINPQLISKTSV